MHDGIARELPRICARLRDACGHDFASYRASTLIRRLHRRMQVRRAATAAAYVSLLEQDPEEARALFRDLLINVTAFFRDQGAFEALAQRVLPELVRRATDDKRLRIWVPACAAGQEAYTIAILMCEELERAKVSRRVQIFATDIDEDCLRAARRGQYPETLLQEVSEERLGRFFQRRGRRFVVSSPRTTWLPTRRSPELT